MTQLAIAGLLDDCRALLEKVETLEDKIIFAKIIHDNFPYRLGCSAQEQWLNGITSVDHRVNTKLHG